MALQWKSWTGRRRQAQKPRQAAVGAPGQVDRSGLQLALEPEQAGALFAEKAPAPGAAAA